MGYNEKVATTKGNIMKTILKIVAGIVGTAGTTFMCYGLWLVHEEEGIRKVFWDAFYEKEEEMKSKK